MTAWFNGPAVPLHLFYNETLTTEGFVNAVTSRALLEGRAIEKYCRAGVMTTSFDDMVAPLTELGWKRLYDNNDGQRSNRTILYLHDDGMIHLHGSPSYGFLTVATLGTELIEKTRKLFDGWTTDKPPRGQVFILGCKGPKLSLMPLGTTNVSLNRRNYSANAVTAFDRAVEELRVTAPNGRLTIIDGPPGTGKSYYVRGLIEALPGTTFVLVPADLIKELGQPNFVPTLVEQHGEGPTVLLLEDADEALVKRMGDNISSIAALLNFADGLLGEMLDVRIVATSNARKLEMEPAMLRAGRLSQHIHVGHLTVDEAQGALEGILGKTVDGGQFAGATVLADVYRRARELGWSAPPTPRPANPRRGLGFGRYFDDD